MDERPQQSHFVKVATFGDLIEGRVVAAKLRSEGIDTRLHSEALGPYPMTVGRLAEVEIGVPSDRLTEAGEVLLDADVNNALAPADADLPNRQATPVAIRMVALAVGLVLVLLWVIRCATIF
jgi:hypothetical protein